MRWISGEISRVEAEIPRHDARSTIILASFVAKSGRVERARADPGAPKGRAMDVEFPENRGTPERRAEGARGALTRRLGEARGGEGRGVIGGAPRRHGGRLCVCRDSACERREKWHGQWEQPSFRPSVWAKRRELDLEFDLSVKLPNMFTNVWSCDQI